MVGLPARGKTYVSQKLCRYLNWLGYHARSFNVGEYRRSQVGASVSHDFFSASNPSGNVARQVAAELALQDLLNWLFNENPVHAKNAVPGEARECFGKAKNRNRNVIVNALEYETTNQEPKEDSASPSSSSLSSTDAALGTITLSKIEDSDNRVAIYDATNTTSERRKWLLSSLLAAGLPLHQILFIELVCNDSHIIDTNIMMVKLSSPDYANVKDKDQALQDFKKRISHYEDVYEPVTQDEFKEIVASLNEGQSPSSKRYSNSNSNHVYYKQASCGVPVIKMFNVKEQLIIMACQQYWQSKIAYYLMNIHTIPRTIYICRHGESELNRLGKIGGDSDLSEGGWKFAKALPNWISSNFGSDKSLIVWTSTLKRTIQTASFLDYPKYCWKALDELDAGICEGLSYEEIQARYPADFSARDKDKYHYRYPEGGESYADLVSRLEPIMMELERQTNILLISHQAVLRTIYSYFVGVAAHDLPYVKIPLHTIIELRPRAYGCDVIYHDIGIPAVDTQRDKPKK